MVVKEKVISREQGMAVEENLNKSMYKLLILMLKYIPMLISLVYVLNTALSYFYGRFNESGMRSGDMDRMMRYMRNSMNGSESEHFTESEAKYLVADMYHTENGRKYSGEKFDMHKAKEICERYRGILPTSATVADVYVAINSQYHDYAELFKNWFGDGIEQKIVESAIVFWFKDADCKAENKVVEYLGEY